MSNAARVGDPTQHGGVLTKGCEDVLIEGRPAARVGDDHQCPASTGTTPHKGGPVLKGSATVFIGGEPAARQGDPCQCNGPVDSVQAGAQTVFIG